MKISQIHIYPIKSLRGVSVPAAQVTRSGFRYDRRFMLLKVVPAEGKAGSGAGNLKGEGETTLRNMHVPHFPEMALFKTELFEPEPTPTLDGKGKSKGVQVDGRIRVTYKGPQRQTRHMASISTTLDVPLTPDTRGLEELAIVMHNSPTKGYNMGERYNAWFSAWFGYDVVLAYLGEGNWRPVLGTFAPAKHVAHKDHVREGFGLRLSLGLVGAVLVLVFVSGVLGSGAGFMVPLTTSGGNVEKGAVAAVAMGLVYLGLKAQGPKEERLTFADTAPYMVVSETSVADVTRRLAGGEKMDVRKFRGNIVVEGAETAFEEDYWAELVAGESKVRLLLTANCVRCRSLDVDYSTGKMGEGESGKVFRKLMGDRRVDLGAKYSPVFGRYGFLGAESNSRTLRVGDEVVVARRMQERAIHDWSFS